MAVGDAAGQRICAHRRLLGDSAAAQGAPVRRVSRRQCSQQPRQGSGTGACTPRGKHTTPRLKLAADCRSSKRLAPL